MDIENYAATEFTEVTITITIQLQFAITITITIRETLIVR